MSDTDLLNSPFFATLSPSEKQFEVLPKQSLLQSGLSAGLLLPHGCADGTCGKCQAKILHGSTNKLKQHDFTFTQAQKINGLCLLCSTTAQSDLLIEVQEATSASDIPLQELQAKQCYSEHINGVVIMRFKFTRGKTFRFMPGQHAQLTFNNNDTVVLPVASCPCDSQNVEFHLFNDQKHATAIKRLYKNISNTKTLRERIKITGPTGTYTLSNDTHKPKLFIANGGDFAQLQGMIEQVLNFDQGISCFLIWSSTKKTPHYRENLCRSWSHAYDEFNFTLIKHDADIQQEIPQQWLEHCDKNEVYLGAQNEQLKTFLVGSGVEPNNIFYPA